MTTSSPPSFYFTGIIFNPSYYKHPEVILSKEQADTLYLKKTTNDTATALETFTSGISTNTISSLGSDTVLSIGENQILGDLNIANNTLRTGNINISSNLTSANIVTIGSINTTVNQILNLNTHTLNLGALFTTQPNKVINIGSTVSTTQVINLNRPLTVNYAPTDLLGFTQIGYSSNTSGTAVNSATSTYNTLLHSITSLPSGIYTCHCNIRCVPTTSVIASQEFGFTSSSPPSTTGTVTYYTGAYQRNSTPFTPSNGNYDLNLTTVCKITNGTIYLVAITTGTLVTFGIQGRINICRIA